ncbi:cytochrome b N-terminal domain-containing protein [Desulfogranum japonicum]|uniref:cytochrome b N-terminal domain-containing protein n=1 Tax=Desulfogranum japonicum TaxID=231447 RepID=UPI0004125D00|nr:cytochrome b N-terminal domain-containing protein [Desulfogranum japonicum]
MNRFPDLLRYVKQLLLNNRWGGQTLISLYISLISGILLAIQYDAHSPYYSTATIELIAPFGRFWRALHYYSSQAFFLLLLGHIVVVLWKKEEMLPRASWIRLCASFPIAVLLLFTGYVLRGDATGEAAGLIAENICLSIPVVGTWLNDLLFDITESGVRKVYLHHLIGFVALGAFSLWPHLRRYPAFWRNHSVLVLAILAISVFLKTPMEPERFGLLHIAGPWFFLGLQELLRYLSTFVAGVIAPCIPVVLLFFLPQKTEKRQWAYIFLALWLIAYCILTWISYQRI